MHGPPTSVTRQEDVLVELDKVVEQGKVRLAGVSGGAESVSELSRTNGHRVRVAQMSANIDDLSAIDVAGGLSAALVIAHHHFGGRTGVRQTIEPWQRWPTTRTCQPRYGSSCGRSTR